MHLDPIVWKVLGSLTIVSLVAMVYYFLMTRHTKIFTSKVGNLMVLPVVVMPPRRKELS